MYSGNVLFFDENHTKSSTISCKHIPGTRVCFTTSMIQHSTAEGSQVVRAKTFHKNVNVCVVQLEHTNSSSSRSRQHASMGASSHRLYTSRVRTQPQYQVRVQQQYPTALLRITPVVIHTYQVTYSTTDPAPYILV